MHQLLHYFFVLRWTLIALKKWMEFHARSVEVTLRFGFGRRYVCSKYGPLMIVLHGAVMLMLGVVLLKPTEVARKLFAYRPALDAIQGFVDATHLSDLNVRGNVEQGLSKLEDTYVIDEAARHGSYYTGVLTELAFESVSFAYALFVVMYVLLATYHHTQAQDSDEVNEHHGSPHLHPLFRGLSADQVTLFVEPLFIVLVGLLIWPELPGSRMRLPFSLAVDPLLGRFLLVSGLMLALKEFFRQSKARQSAEDITSLSRKMGGDPVTAEGGEAEFDLAEIVARAVAPTPTIETAYAGLPAELIATMTNVPVSLGVQAEGPPTADDSLTPASPKKRGVVACPHCQKLYRLAKPPAPERVVTCAACDRQYAFAQMVAVDESRD